MTAQCPATVVYAETASRRCTLPPGHAGPHQAHGLTWPKEEG